MKSFLRRLRKTLEGFSRGKLGPKGPPAIDPQEPIARYLLHKNLFRAEKKRVMAAAFLPAPGSVRTSVFRIAGLQEPEIWGIGEARVSNPLRKTLYGRADILAFQVESGGLRIDPDNVPERHANIAGWPEEKDKQMLRAQELAAVAVLKLR